MAGGSLPILAVWVGIDRDAFRPRNKVTTHVPRRTNNDVCVLAARGLRKQVKLLAEHLGGIRLGEEIESLHRTRVASRRLRAVLAMFGDCWKRKRVKNWKREIRQLARDLSEARDRDVQIEFLDASLARISDPALVPGIARLLSHVEQQRQWLQPRVLRAVDRIEHSIVLKDMQTAARRVIDDAGDGTFQPGAAARRHAAKAVRKRLKKLMAEAPGLRSAEHSQQHHAMRIAAKRLRYTLELAKPHRSPELDSIAEMIKRLQTLLGEIHDCDVWAENLDAFARTEAEQVHVFFGDSRRFNRLMPGIDYLRKERKARREQCFSELSAFWQELSEKHIWDRLIELLKSDAAAEPSSNGAAAVAHESGTIN
jgi:CHAD domain-containing protein